MPFEMPYPCRSFEPHGTHGHDALVFNGTDSYGQPTYRLETGMWCAGYAPPGKDADVWAEYVQNDVTGQTLIEMVTGKTPES